MRRISKARRAGAGLAVAALATIGASMIPAPVGAASNPQLTDAFNPGQVIIGGISTDTFTITNPAGLPGSSGWAFGVALPAGVVVAPMPNAVTTCAAGTISAAPGATSIGVSAGTIAAGVSSCTVTVDVTAPAEGVYTNKAADYTTLTGLNPPPVWAQLFVSAPEFDISKVASTAVAHPGDVVTYTIKVTDTGGVAVADASIVDDLTNVLSHGSVVAGSVTASAGSASFATPTMTWHGPVAADGTVTITYQVKMGAADPVNTQTLVNTVLDSTPNAYSNCEGPHPVDPACTATVSIPPAAVTSPSTIKIVKTSSTPLATAGGTIDYTLAVTNTGPNTDLAPVVTDTLVPGLTWEAAPAGCTISGQTLTCTLADLPAGASTDIKAKAKVSASFPDSSLDAAGKVPNGARVRSSNTTDCPAATSTAPECTSGVDTPLGGTSPVSVTAPPPPVSSPSVTAPRPPTSVPHAGLAFTGTPVTGLLVVAQLALLAGIGLLAAGRAKRRHKSAHAR